MTEHSWLWFVLNWLGLPALALLAIVLIYRHWSRVFPYFLIYVISAEAIGLIRLAASRFLPNAYSKIYWISDTVLAAAAFLAAYELLFKRLFPAFYRVRFYRSLFPAAAILITVVMIVSAYFRGHFSILATAIHTYELLLAAALFFFVLLMLIMGRHWGKQEFGIAFGFGLVASTSLIVLSIWSHASKRATFAGWSVIAYDLACLIWLYCFWPAPQAQAFTPSPELSTEALQEAKKWEDSLKDFMSQGKR
jgi:hypothetical protein